VVSRGEGVKWEATLYARSRKHPFAIVRGSWPYVRRGLRAAGLSPPVRLFEDGDGRELTLVGSEPSHRYAKGAR
jgi:hypothetical protein